ncbi:molybdenum cofactor biosynthesis protein [Virgibacillus dakarensis]|uniref:Molybdenum cofactor biosynthesis protein B n=1 Tax=Lentibacillus populi TaxID=1827502 RepID=A0A9W5X3X0_9BACI|nr:MULTISPECIES: molybdenum cofactor biosynthesis protein B [Bacillaceae]MBT2216588.1 molybdenum cofactor biosynthesis protein MoaB [Virgibacillus dakarensis]MTW84310.1 molybdenum cofactor biosynthesis protein [Virgibacillus dakarensis]GGB27405.1 molybdenum cofactor biosynthesis protein B [Lentibacillus populi]
MPHQIAYKSLNCMIITISDTRTKETDKSGRLMTELLKQAGHQVQSAEIVPDETSAIENKVKAGAENPNVDVILTNGGTGISFRDVTIETIKDMLDKEMTGFGEIFRMLSYQEDIGSAAILSRAIAGVINRTAIFATPGSTGAVKLAMNKLILPELSHVVHEINKDKE